MLFKARVGLFYKFKEDTCTGVHSPCQREKNGHNLDIWLLRLRQGQMQIFLGLKVGEGPDFQIWDLNRVHKTKRTVFPISGVFGVCIDADYDMKEKHNGYSTNSAMNTL